MLFKISSIINAVADAIQETETGVPYAYHKKRDPLDSDENQEPIPADTMRNLQRDNLEIILGKPATSSQFLDYNDIAKKFLKEHLTKIGHPNLKDYLKYLYVDWKKEPDLKLQDQ